MSDAVIEVDRLWKKYRLGVVSTGTLAHDINRWLHRVRGKPDPYLIVDVAGKVVPGNKRPEAKRPRAVADSDALNSGLQSHGPGQPPARPEPFVLQTDEIWALRDVSFAVKSGEILGIIGRNGAGKSTLLKLLSRVTAPTTGEMRIKGRVASLLEVGTGFHPELTGRENIFLNGAILGMTKEEIKRNFDAIVAFAEVEKFIDTPVKRYSSGMYVRLAFAVAAHLESEILIVDEVLAVGDTDFQKKCMGKMGQVTKAGRTVLFVSHNLAAIAQLTSQCLMLEGGSVKYFGHTENAIQGYMSHEQPTAAGGRVRIENLPCEYHMLRDGRARFVEAGLAEGQAGEIQVGGDLRLSTLIETSTGLENLRFAYTVRDQFGGALLAGWSAPFSLLEKGSHERDLVIQELFLAPGRYDLVLSLSTGGLSETKYVYDIIVGFCPFSVGQHLTDQTPISEWHQVWGRLFHRKSSLVATVGAQGGGGGKQPHGVASPRD